MSLEGRRVGLIEDDPIMGESLVQRLELEGMAVTWWSDGRSAVKNCAAVCNGLDLVICDIRLPDMDGEEVFRHVSTIGNPPPFLFITAYADIDQAVRLMRAGAGDYVTKPFVMNDFLARLAGTIRVEGAAGEDASLGVSRVMRDLEALLRRVADHALPVLLTGETGVGKEVAARFLHGVSSRGAFPFMAVNCAAIPGDLLESELFGHERGAFTGAATRHLGYAERAGEGTLFLDEIGDMPLHMQAKLLRLVEDGFFFRVGGETPVPFQARIVSASHQNLPKTIEVGRFRQDLFYRLNALTIPIPPLRERPEDVLWLAERFLSDLAGEPRTLSALAEEAAMTYEWPGNVRELRNRLERAAVLASGACLMPGDLFPEFHPPASLDDLLPTLARVRDQAERRQIERTLRVTKGQIAEAAQLLGVSRTTLWEKMRRHGLRDPVPL